ncbi:MAG: hypothetical protein EBR62_08210, partial [Verrucomicrobia bacterium]|nr:hypothetical protein [Verrucomicrobiota bacterium]
MTKSGPGDLNLSGANTYTGGTFIAGGSVLINSDASLGAVPATAATNLTLSGGRLLVYPNNVTLAATRNVTLLGDASALNAGTNTTLTVNGVISGPGGLMANGAGTLVLGNANTFTGNTRPASGTLILGDANALAGSTLELNAADLGAVSFGTLTAASLGGLQGNRNLVLTNAATTPAALALTVGGNGASTAFSGVLSGLGSLVKNGAGTLALSNYTVTATTTSGLTTVTALSGTSGLSVGQSVTGANIAAGTTIAAINGTTITLSQA